MNCTVCVGIQRYIEDYQARCITTFKTYCQKRRSYLLNLPEGMLILRLMCLMANLYRVECYKQVNILIYCGMTAALRNARDASSDHGLWGGWFGRDGAHLCKWDLSEWIRISAPTNLHRVREPCRDQSSTHVITFMLPSIHTCHLILVMHKASFIIDYIHRLCLCLLRYSSRQCTSTTLGHSNAHWLYKPCAADIFAISLIKATRNSKFKHFMVR